MTGQLSRGSLLMAVLGFTLIAATALSRWVSAQQPGQITISVSPTVFELSANPGQTLSNSFRIVNGTDQPLTLEAGPKNFTASGEEGAVNLTEEETAFSLASWIGVEPAQVVVPARGSQTFDFSIAVPDNAEPGGHFGSVIVKTQPIAIDATGAAVSQEAGPLILVKVAGDIVEKASIASFSSPRLIWTGSPISLETRVQNVGNVHLKPRGTVSIKNLFGNEVTNINLEERNVLPGTVRKLITEWSPGFTVGRFTADLSLVYGADNTIVTASTSFIVFPYKVILPVILGLIVLIYLLIRFRRRILAAGRALAGR